MFGTLFHKIRNFWEKNKIVNRLSNTSVVDCNTFPPTIAQRVGHDNCNAYTLRRRAERKKRQPIEKKSRMRNYLMPKGK